MKRLRVLVAPNAFKGCLTAAEAAREMARGVRRACPDSAIDLMPISDGGDGLMEVLLDRVGGRRIYRRVTGPLGRSRLACYAILRDGKTAVIEMAQASGIAGLDRRSLDPLGATSYGTGELIRDALRRGVRRIVVGMGGSATNDGGSGMASALGVRFYDNAGRELPRGAQPLERLARVDMAGFVSLSGVSVVAVSDVRNPLLGRLGSARVYGPQKGATPAMVRILDRALTRYARVLRRDLGQDVARVAGSGAAGGLGAGLLAFLRAAIMPGADWVLGRLDAGRRIMGADLVLTGEGKLDIQSFYGKAPVTLARKAKQRGVAVRFICGQIDPAARGRLKPWGRSAAYALTLEGEDPAVGMRGSHARLRAAAQRAVRDVFLATVLLIVVMTSAWAKSPLSGSPTDGAASETALSEAASSSATSLAGNKSTPSLLQADYLYFHRNVGDNLDRSLKMLTALLDQKSDDPQVLWRLGRATVRHGERIKGEKERLACFKRAEEYLKRSVAADPDIAEAHFWLGLAYGRRGQAQGILKSLFLIRPIRKEMNRTLELEPNYGGAHHVLGEMLREIPAFAGGSKKGAVAEMEKALALSPAHTSNYPDAARAYLDAGQRDKAIETLKKAFEVKDPADPVEYQDDLNEAAGMLRKLGVSR